MEISKAQEKAMKRFRKQKDAENRNVFRNEIKARESIIADIKAKLDADMLNSATTEEKRIAIANKRRYIAAEKKMRKRLEETNAAIRKNFAEQKKIVAMHFQKYGCYDVNNVL